MEENTHFWHILLYYFKKRKNATEMQKKKKRFVDFSVDFSPDDAPRSGRPVEVDSDQIETLLETNQYYTTREIDDILKISKPIQLLVNMKNVSFVLQRKSHELLANPILLHLCRSDHCLSH